jgi:Domain of unknown function (DUF4394)
MTCNVTRLLRTGAAATIFSAGLATTASAATLALLQDGKTIVWVDTDQKKVVGSVGLAGGATLVGFDVRPADGRLYGVTPDGAIVRVDAKTGAWEKVSQLSEALPAGVAIAVDFNPMADRMRIVSASGMSLRVNVMDGKAVVDGSLKFGDADPHAGKTPHVTAVGYTNSMAGAKETALYDIDAAHALLVRQAPPNDGILVTVGPLGVKIDGPVAFDIWSDGKGTNVGWLLAGGRLHAVDLTSGTAGMATAVAGLQGRILDLAILPAM